MRVGFNENQKKFRIEKLSEKIAVQNSFQLDKVCKLSGNIIIWKTEFLNLQLMNKYTYYSNVLFVPWKCNIQIITWCIGFPPKIG